LLEINNAVVSVLDLESLLKVIFDCVRAVFQQTIAATLSIYEPESDQLRVHLLHSPQPETFREGMPIPLEGTPSGLAFTSRRTVLIPAGPGRRAIPNGGISRVSWWEDR
jgi:hypothetical protein